MSVFEYLTKRQFFDAKLSQRTISDITTQKLPYLFKPSNFFLGKTDKVFASKWLDDRKIICGTKCNKLMVLDMLTKEKVVIPMLQGSPHIEMPEASAGVHDIQINQSRSLLATNGDNPNHLAIYRLPTLDPVLVGESHSDWVFGVEWISDRIVATGSRDGAISIWNTDDVELSKDFLNFSTGRSHNMRPPSISPTATMISPLNQDKIRDLAYNNNTEHLAALSPNAYIYIWDVATERKLSTIHLPYEFENVCLAMQKEKGLYAVGSQSDVSFLDSRTDKNVLNIRTRDVGAGVRSVSFKDSLVTIGTGHGSVFFYDLHNNKFLFNKSGQCHIIKSGKGWLRLDSSVYEFFTDQEVDCFKNSIYTHCYDPSGTKLFTAGGPLALILYGNYAALWE